MAEETRKHDVPHKPEVESPAQGAPKEDERNARILGVLARVHPTARNLELREVHNVGSNLYLVEFSFHPAAGVGTYTEALVFDKDGKTFVFPGH